MFVLKSLTFFICATIPFSEGRFVDTLNKCSIMDNDCQANLVTTILKKIDKTGVPELGIPPTDPFEFNNITLTIMDLITLEATEGTMKGIKNCEVENYKTVIEKGHTEMTLVCSSVVLKTKYKVSGSNPLLKNILGGESIHGEGNGKVKIEKVKFNMDYIYDIVKKEDGDTYFKWRNDKSIYTYEILGKVTFAIDKIYLGNTEASQLVTGFMNENSKFLIGNFGNPFLDKAMELVYQYTYKFFQQIPTKYYITEDLSKYIKS